ncbi:hypothetical protein QBC36DRAFT_198551, partial [Triangularia setosa]
HQGNNVRSQVNYGGEQEIGKLKFGRSLTQGESTAALNAPIHQSQSPDTTHNGNNHMSNVIYEGTKQEIKELSFD